MSTPQVKPMDYIFLLLEKIESSDPEEQLSAWQELYDTGIYKGMQGWYGRTIQQLINQGLIKT